MLKSDALQNDRIVPSICQAVADKRELRAGAASGQASEGTGSTASGPEGRGSLPPLTYLLKQLLNNVKAGGKLVY